MEKLHLFLISLVLLALLVKQGSSASISPEGYWKLKLPYTPMPETIKELLAPAGGESMDTPLKRLRPNVKESLSGISYNGYLSYNKESLASSSPSYLSYDKQGLDSSNPNYLSYINNKGLNLENPKYLSYSKQGLDSNNPNYLSYTSNKQGLNSNNPKYLSYNKQGLDSSNPNYLSYTSNKQGLNSEDPKYLSYNKQELDSSNPNYLSYVNNKGLNLENPKYLSYNKQGLDSSNPNYLSYTSNKQGLDSNNPNYLSYNKQGLESTKGYDGLLSYNKQGLESTKGYDGLLSYDKKQLASTKNYGSLLSYNKKHLASTKGYGSLLSYNKQGLESANGKNGLLSDNKQAGYGSLLSYQKRHDQAKESSHATKDQVFFVEESLHLGTKMSLHFQKGTKKSSLFLPRDVSNKIPFSSKKIQETLKILSLDPKSNEAYVLSKRIELCEEPTIEGVEKKCVTSLESMVDYVISKIGTNVKAVTTQVEKDHSMMEYTIKGVQELVKGEHETVVCHKMGYPYALFFCHRTKTIRSYMVSLVAKDGTKIEAVAACHKETNDFLDNYAKNILKVEPGSTRICHFPAADDTIIWVTK